MDEAKRLLRLAAPVICQFVLDKSVQVTAIIMVGHLGADQLAATSLGASLANVTGNSFLTAFASGLSTLCGQAYGAGNYEAVGHWCQRAMLMLTLLCVPISAVWLFARPLLLALSQEVAVAHMTAAYIRLLIPGLFASGVNYSITFYLQSQGIMRPGAIASLAMAAFAVPLNWIFIYTYGFEYLGAAMATSLLYLLRTAVLLVYMQSTGVHRKTWSSWSWECLVKWGPFLRLGLPSLVLVSEWWASETAVLMAGYLAFPQLSLAAMAIYHNSASLAFMLPAGMAVACSTRVANELGAGNGKAAAHAAKVSVALIAGIASILSCLLLVFRKPWSKLFSDDQALLRAVQGALQVLAGYIVLDSLQCTIAGTISGCGRQLAAAPIVIVSYWVVGLPTAILLGFKAHLGVLGLCLGMLIGTAVHLILVVWLWLRTDWPGEVAQAARRAETPSKLPVFQTPGLADDANPALVPPVLDGCAGAEQLELLPQQQKDSRGPAQDPHLQLKPPSSGVTTQRH